MWNLFLRAVDILALLLLIAIFPIPFFWFLIHPAISFWRRVGTRWYLIVVPPSRVTYSRTFCLPGRRPGKGFSYR